MQEPDHAVPRPPPARLVWMRFHPHPAMDVGDGMWVGPHLLRLRSDSLPSCIVVETS